MSDIQREEFTNWMVLLRSDIREIGARIDILGGRIGDLEQKVAVLEDRSTMTHHGAAAAWGGGGAGVMVSLAELARWYLGK